MPGSGADRSCSGTCTEEEYHDEGFTIEQCKQSCQNNDDCHGFIFTIRGCWRIKNIQVADCLNNPHTDLYISKSGINILG